MVVQPAQALARPRRAVELEAVARQVGGQRRGEVLVVVDQQQAGHLHIVGSAVGLSHASPSARRAAP